MPGIQEIDELEFAMPAVAPVTAWLGALQASLRAAAGQVEDDEAVLAMNDFIERHAAELATVGAQMRADAIDAVNRSSVALGNPAKLILPPLGDVQALGKAASSTLALASSPVLPAHTAQLDALAAAAATMGDAALALLQALAVQNARTRWGLGEKTSETPRDATAKHAWSQLDQIFNDSGYGTKVGIVARDGSTWCADWCGMFVAASYFSGAQLFPKIREGLWDTLNIEDIFQYEQNHNEARAPLHITVGGKVQSLVSYHRARRSLRRWTSRQQIRDALATGVDIRPGDTCLIDHHGGDVPGHIVMVESWNPATRILVTIEGNTVGVTPGANPAIAARSADGAHLLKFGVRMSSTGIHQIDLGTLAYPRAVIVTDPQAYLRDANDPSTLLHDADGKPIVLRVGSALTVTGEITLSGQIYLRLAPGGIYSGCTLRSNVVAATAANLPADAQPPFIGATVYAVCRPSLADFDADLNLST